MASHIAIAWKLESQWTLQLERNDQQTRSQKYKCYLQNYTERVMDSSTP